MTEEIFIEVVVYYKPTYAKYDRTGLIQGRPTPSPLRLRYTASSSTSFKKLVEKVEGDFKDNDKVLMITCTSYGKQFVNKGTFEFDIEADAEKKIITVKEHKDRSRHMLLSQVKF